MDRSQFEVFTDYSEVGLLFTLVCLFAPIFPLGALFAFNNNVVEIRVDTLRMMKKDGRITPVRQDGIGPWMRIFSISVYLSMIFGLCIVFVPLNPAMYLFHDGRMPVLALGVVVVIFLFEKISLLISAIVVTVVKEVPPSVELEKRGRERLMAHKIKEFRASRRRRAVMNKLKAAAKLAGKG